MTTVTTKPIVAIERDESIVALFGDVVTIDKSLGLKLSMIADQLAAQVATLTLPHASKCALIEATYTGEFKAIAGNRNTAATLRALIVCKVAGSLKVETKAPSADGKVAAVYQPASKLSASAAKTHAAEIKALAVEAEETPSQKLAREQASAKVAHAEQEKRNAEASAEATAFADKAFAFCLADGTRDRLVSELLNIGYKLIKTYPKA